MEPRGTQDGGYQLLRVPATRIINGNPSLRSVLHLFLIWKSYFKIAAVAVVLEF